jgi:hypothetical protein
LEIKNGKDALDNYAFYGNDNMLIDSANAYKKRYILFDWSSDNSIVTD